MEALLIDRWTRGLSSEPTLDEASVTLAVERVRRTATDAGLTATDAAMLATVTSELGRNQLRHARRGSLAVRSVVRGDVAGVEVIAADGGEGIEDLDRLTATTARAEGSLGIGLSGVLELADEVDFDVRLGEGTCVWARKFAGSPPRSRALAIVGRPIESERRSGDDATFVRFDDGSLLVAVADGLGHGDEARAAASVAIECVLREPSRAPDELLADCHRALARSRGAVMGIARIAPDALGVAISGNVSVRALGRKPGEDRRFAGPSFALGMPGHAPRMRLEHDELGPYEMLVAFSDGLSSRLAVDAAHFGAPPLLAARRLLDAFSDGRDDALVAVVR